VALEGSAGRLAFYPGGWNAWFEGDGWLKPPLAYSAVEMPFPFCPDNCTVGGIEAAFERSVVGYGIPEPRLSDPTYGGLCESSWAGDAAPALPRKGVTTEFAIVADGLPAAESALHWVLAFIRANKDVLRFVLCCKARHLGFEYSGAQFRLQRFIDGTTRRLTRWESLTFGGSFGSLEELGPPAFELLGEAEWGSMLAALGASTSEIAMSMGAFDRATDTIYIRWRSQYFSPFVELFNKTRYGRVPLQGGVAARAVLVVVHELLHWLLPRQFHKECASYPREREPDPVLEALGDDDPAYYDFRKCDVVTVSTNAFLWGAYSRYRDESVVLRFLSPKGCAKPFSEQKYKITSTEPYDNAWIGLWGLAADAAEI
jgi:hypothetical protein